ncbi:hypothetical protein [Sodalis sp. dw_96]|uniref:hypothetical protein n=1 Tax=Sodalis sp. dw_96 TaxID=2719794 RepID=UPI001BD6671B|nr:hypothetical protein [Sodalis sp. dw_96]
MIKTKLACLLSFSLLFAAPGICANQTDGTKEGEDVSAPHTVSKLSDDEIKTEILRDYLRYHIRDRGPCPCPELRSSDNKRCGKRSAWSRKANKTVMCYKDDVTQDMIDDWKEQFALYGHKENVEPKTARAIEIAGKVDEYLENYGANDEFDRNYNN